MFACMCPSIRAMSVHCLSGPVSLCLSVWSCLSMCACMYPPLSYECALPVWSCAWNADDPTYFYAGLQNGTVCLFDTRHLSGPVEQMSGGDLGSRSQVVSLQHIPLVTGNTVRWGRSGLRMSYALLSLALVTCDDYSMWQRS